MIFLWFLNIQFSLWLSHYYQFMIYLFIFCGWVRVCHSTLIFWTVCSLALTHHRGSTPYALEKTTYSTGLEPVDTLTTVLIMSFRTFMFALGFVCLVLLVTQTGRYILNSTYRLVYFINISAKLGLRVLKSCHSHLGLLNAWSQNHHLLIPVTLQVRSWGRDSSSVIVTHDA